MHIDVFQDTVCPWCRVGKAHLQAALATWYAQGGQPVTVTYRAFFLNPTIPPQGYPFRDYMLAKGHGQITLEQFFDGPRRAGAAAGVQFNFEAIKCAPNTLLSHQLIALTPKPQRETIIEAIYKAYFEDAQDIGELAVLLDIASAHGLDAAATRSALQNGDQREAVLAEVDHARQIGVSGVPFFVVNNMLAFSGAQPPEIILQVLQQAQDFAPLRPS